MKGYIGMKLSISISKLMVALFLFLPISLSVFGAQAPAAMGLLTCAIIILQGNGKMLIVKELWSLPILAIYVYWFFRYSQCGYFLGYLNVLCGTIITTYVIVVLVDSEEKFFDLLKCLVNAALIYAVLSIIESFTRFNIFDVISGKTYFAQEQMMRFGIYRPKGMCTMTINNCILLSFVASLIAFYLYSSKKTTTIDKCAYVLTLVAAILTLSRAGIIMLVISQLYIGITTGFIKNPKRILYGLLGGASGVLLVNIFNISSIKNALQQFYLMFAIVFDNSLGNDLSTSFGANPNGVGHREMLFEWVMDAVKGHELWGLGINARFEHRISQSTIKTSIENYYLAQYFMAGQVAVVLVCIAFAAIIIYALLNRKYNIAEGKCSLNSILIVLMLCYCVVLTTVAASDDLRMLCLFCGFVIAHNRICANNNIE